MIRFSVLKEVGRTDSNWKDFAKSGRDTSTCRGRQEGVGFALEHDRCQCAGGGVGGCVAEVEVSVNE